MRFIANHRHRRIDNPALWSFESAIVSKEQDKELAIWFINNYFNTNKAELNNRSSYYFKKLACPQLEPP